jgi:hypothetical protein
VGPDAFKRIADYKETEEDERRAEQAVLHYHAWTDRNLVAALTWSNWGYYQFV